MGEVDRVSYPPFMSASEHWTNGDGKEEEAWNQNATRLVKFSMESGDSVQ